MKVKEIKHRLDGSTKTFECEVIEGSDNKAILSYIWDRKTPYKDGPVFLPAGPIHTNAFYWRDRNYLVYKLSSQDGLLFGYRIDACENVSISKDKIEWLDLILDFWIDPSNKLYVLDKDELNIALRKKTISLNQYAKALLVENYLLGHYLELLSEINT